MTIWNTKPLCLQLEHIDGNSDNNKLNNLQLLCPNCHSQTPTWGAKNIGSHSSRNIIRRKRYNKAPVIGSDYESVEP